MIRFTSRVLIAGAALLSSAACADSTATSPTALSLGSLTAALSSVPVGYGDLSTSFVGITASGAPSAGLWIGGGREASFDRGGMMGGGFHDAFVGGIGFDGRGGHRGPFGGGHGCSGTFDAPSGRVVCADETRNGVTVKRSAQYKDAAGAVQQAFDTLTTNSVNLQSAVSGTLTFNRAADSLDSNGRGPGGPGGHGHWGRGRGPGGRLLGDTSTVLTATTTINSTSSRTTTGLAAASTQRTVNGASAGTESTTGTSTRGSFTATRSVGDTTSGVIIPVVTGGKSYPTAGTVIRSMQATLKYANETAVTLSRREVVTYDGTAVAKVQITENGTTKSCTRPLPRGPLSCS
jgi:hypothetical protein